MVVRKGGRESMSSQRIAQVDDFPDIDPFRLTTRGIQARPLSSIPIHTNLPGQGFGSVWSQRPRPQESYNNYTRNTRRFVGRVLDSWGYVLNGLFSI